MFARCLIKEYLSTMASTVGRPGTVHQHSSTSLLRQESTTSSGNVTPGHLFVPVFSESTTSSGNITPGHLLVPVFSESTTS